MGHSLNRRNFLKTSTLATGAVVFGVPLLLRGQNLNSKLNIAAIGAGGRGARDTDSCAAENIVALCDVDTARCAGQLEKYPHAKFYHDFRKMFDQLGKGIDAVTVATPDHFHAVAASAAMRLGKHTYCEKPLTQTIYEARYLLDLARTSGVVTQMGNQGSAADGLRRAVECVQAGIIGQVREVHVWTPGTSWAQGMNRPAGSDPVPNTLKWDLWLGPAPARPYKNKIYAPFVWRGWQDFGTGVLGDMACHTANLSFRALCLGYPKAVEAESFSAMNQETYPIGSKIRFEFPARNNGALSLDPLTLWWYDGKRSDEKTDRRRVSNQPARELTADIAAFRGEVPSSGCLLLGDKGKIFSPDDYGEQFFLKLKDESKFTHYRKHAAIAAVPQTLPRAGKAGHPQEWLEAIKAGQPEQCYSRFSIGAQLSEIILLGCVALRVGKRIEWDGPNMRVTNAPEAARFIKRENRSGWNLA